MSKNSIPFFWTILLSCVLLIAFSGAVVWLSLKPPAPSKPILADNIKPGAFQIEADPEYSVNTSFKIKIIADTQDQAANAVGLSLTFDPDKLMISTVDTSQSFCQFYPENKYDNSQGTVTISCGAPNPGFSGKNTIATILFYAKNIGKTRISIDPKKSQILLNNGLGTNIYQNNTYHDLIIVNNL